MTTVKRLATLAVIPMIWATAGAQTGDGSSVGNINEPLNYCKVTIIDQVSVPAREPGVLEELNVKEGDLVEKGALLGTIDKVDAELTLQIAIHEYAAARKEAENTLSIRAAAASSKVAGLEADSSKLANKRTPGTVPGVELRRQILQADRAEMQIELAEHELNVAHLTALAKHSQFQRAKASLVRRQIISPINGVVVQVNKHVGDWAQAGETVLRIVRLDQLRVEGEIDGMKYARHEVPNRPVEIVVHLTGGGTETMQGIIDFASPMIESPDAQTVEYTVRATINNRKVGAPGNQSWLITPGLNAEMRLKDGPQIGKRAQEELFQAQLGQPR